MSIVWKKELLEEIPHSYKRVLGNIKQFDSCFWGNIISIIQNLKQNENLICDDRIRRLEGKEERRIKVSGIVIVRSCSAFANQRNEKYSRIQFHNSQNPLSRWVFAFRGYKTLPIYHCKNPIYFHESGEWRIQKSQCGIALNRKHMYRLTNFTKDDFGQLNETVQWYSFNSSGSEKIIHGEHNLFIPSTMFDSILKANENKL